MLNLLAPPGIDPARILAEDDSGRVLRYGDLGGLGSEWRARLPGRRLVLLACANTVPHLAAYSGLRAAGHAVVLLPEAIAEATLVDLIATYRAEALVCADETGEVNLKVLRPAEGGLHPELGVCLSTSGSTGSPKLVRFSDDRLAANAHAIRDYLQIGSDDVAMAHLPFEYSFGLSVVHSHVAAGARLLLSKHSIMQKPFWQRLTQATSIAGVPFHFEMLLRMRLEGAVLPELRVLTQAGGHLPTPLVAQVHDIAERRGWKFHVMYGQTEAGPRISWLPHDLVTRWPGCIGQAIPGVTILLEEGELVVESPSIMMGYALGRDDLARDDDMGGRLVTGDLAELAGPGIFRITGRKSRFLKIQGNRVSLQGIETRLLEVGHEVHCVGRDDLLVICTTAPDPEAIRRAAVALFSFPTRSVNVKSIPDTPRRANGKIDYAALTRIALEGPA